MNTEQMKPIVICRCWSSAVNYIHDVRELGYEPVLLEPYIRDEMLRAAVREDYARAYQLNGDDRPRVVTEKETYGGTLEMIREIDPVLILPGCDNGIWPALRLSHDLGLKSNALADFPGIHDKFRMQAVLRDAGLRYMPTKILNSEEEASAFWREQTGKPVVLKISEGTATVGVRFCGSEEETIGAWRELQELLRFRGRVSEAVIGQPFAEGPEYAFDTISCEGRHVALYGWKYAKKKLPGYATIYDRTIYISPDEEEYTDLVEYVFQVLTALHIRYGPVHTEVIRTAVGPVLVEVNCRPGGGEQRYSYQDRIMQEHETMAALHSYLLEPEEFFLRYPERMHLKQAAAGKDICLKQELDVERVTIGEACAHLPTFVYALHNGDHRVYPKTTDLSTCGGTVYLAGPDEAELMKDLDHIAWLEEEHPERLYQIRK